MVEYIKIFIDKSYLKPTKERNFEEEQVDMQGQFYPFSNYADHVLNQARVSHTSESESLSLNSPTSSAIMNSNTIIRRALAARSISTRTLRPSANAVRHYSTQEPDPQLNGYPQLPWKSRQNLPPLGWQDSLTRRNFGDPVHKILFLKYATLVLNNEFAAP